ncbi:hypothetical protein KIN20_004840, partial [Parelaphostrongylus tenuis]
PLCFIDENAASRAPARAKGLYFLPILPNNFQARFAVGVSVYSGVLNAPTVFAERAEHVQIGNSEANACPETWELTRAQLSPWRPIPHVWSDTDRSIDFCSDHK